MVKRAGERVRPITPTSYQQEQQQQQQQYGGTERPASGPRLSPEPTGKLDIASWAAAAAEALHKTSAAGSAASGRPYQPQPQQLQQQAPQVQAGPGSHARPRCTDGSSYSAASSQQQQQQHLQKLLYLQQQQQQILQAAAGSPSHRRMASPAAAPAPAAPANSSGVPAPGQRPAGPFSPLFTGGGMWSSQGVVDRSQQEQYAAAARQQAGSAPAGSRQSSIVGGFSPEGAHLERLEEVPRSRPATSSTVRTHTSRTPPPAALGAGNQGGGGMTTRSNYSSVLSAGSYQAAAAAAAAAVVAANARNRGGLSPGRGGTLQEVERTYVAAAANAAASRAMARTPSPGPTRPGYDRDLLPPTSRSVSPGREMRPPGFEPGDGARGPYHHSSVAGSAVSASDISSASRPAGLHTAAVPNSASSGKFRAAPSPKGVSSRHVVPDLQGAQHGWAAPGMGSGQPQPWDGAGSLASLPLELPTHFGDTSMAPTGPVHAALRSHPADIFMFEQQQGSVGGGSNGRRARGHCRSSSDGGGGGGLGVVNSGGNSGRNDYHRPSSDSRLKSTYLRQQEDHQWQQQRLRQQQQQQQQQRQQVEEEEDDDDEQGKRRSSSSSDGEEPARWHSTLERLRTQQHQQHQQQQHAHRSDREWEDPEQGEQSGYEEDCSGPVLHHLHIRTHASTRQTPCPEPLCDMGGGHHLGRGGAKLQAASREPSQTSVGPREDRRGSVHSSCAGSRVSAGTSASKAKYSAYPGHAAPGYNPKPAGPPMPYLQGADKSPQRRRSLTPEQLHHCPEPGHHPIDDPDSPDAADAAAHAGLPMPAPGAASLSGRASPEQQRSRVSFNPDEQHQHAARNGKYGSKLEVRVSAGSDDSRGSNAPACCGLSKRAVWTTLTVLLLIVMAGTGVGVGVAFAKGKSSGGAGVQQQQQAAPAAKAAAMSMSVFGVTARPALPGMSSDQRCKLWFGSPEKLQQYQQVFSGAYAHALSIPASDIHVLGVSCDGVNMLAAQHSTDGKATAPGSRSLLASAAASLVGAADSAPAPDPLLAALLAQPGSGSLPDTTNGVSEVVTHFSVTASSDSSVLTSVTTRVTSWAPNILAAPLAQFYRGAVQVQPAGQLEGWQKLAAPAAVPGSAPAGTPVLPMATVGTAAVAPAPIPTAAAPQAAAAAQQQGQASSTTPAAVQQSTPAPATHAQTQAAPADPTPAVDANALDPDEEPEEPPNKQAAKNSAAAAAAAGKKGATGKASSSSSSIDDDYYPIDSEDAAVASSNEDASAYEGLDPEEMPIEPPPPAPAGSKARAADSADADAGAGGGAADADGAQWVEFYDNAPTCAGVPTIMNSVYDGSGRLWGWEKKAMCVFRATSPQWAPVTWKEAKACSGVPTAVNSVYDESGKLWGWQDSSNCAFKVDGKAVKPAQLSWKTAAACSGQASSSNSVADLNGKKWGWSNGRACAFRQASKA